MVKIEQAKLSELTEIMAIERSGFSAAEAASSAAMRERIERLSDTFLVAVADGKVVGFVVACAGQSRYVADDLFESVTENAAADSYLLVLSIAVLPDYQHRGIASQLLSALTDIARQQNRAAVSLTCLEEKIGFYQMNGYVNEGVSASTHADEVWYNMVLELN